MLTKEMRCSDVSNKIYFVVRVDRAHRRAQPMLALPCAGLTYTWGISQKISIYSGSLFASKGTAHLALAIHLKLTWSPSSQRICRRLSLRYLYCRESIFARKQTRAGMYKIMGEDVSSHLKAKNTPGVFIQGLVVYAGAGDEVVYERVLDVGVVSQVASFCEKQGVSLIAYSGDRIVSCEQALG